MRRIIKIHNSNKHLEFKSNEKYFDAGVERERQKLEVETRIEDFELLRNSSLLPKEKSYSRFGIFEVD